MDVGLRETLLSRREASGRPLLMGVLNATPDSFYDGGRYVAGVDQQRRLDGLIAEGADILDVGGESTRPLAQPVPAAEQIRRIEPALAHAVAQARVLVSVDTTLPAVAEHALGIGAHIINDVSCLAESDLARVTAQHDAVLILMHSRGPMSEMRGFSQYPEQGYSDVVTEVMAEWCRARDRAVAAGMSEERIWFDPGLGFAKNARHSYEILSRLREFGTLTTRVVVGPSRKSFIAAAEPAPAEERLGGTIAACLAAAERGADVLRVHDVAAVRQALSVAELAREPGGQEARLA